MKTINRKRAKLTPITLIVPQGVAMNPAAASEVFLRLPSIIIFGRSLTVIFAAMLFSANVCGQGATASPTLSPTSVVDGEWEPMSSIYVQTLGRLVIKDRRISWGKCRDVPFVIVEDIQREDDLMSYGLSEKKIQPYRDVMLHIKRSAICNQPLNLLSDPPHEVIRFLIPETDPCYADILIYKSIKNNKPQNLSAKGSSYNVGGACKRP